MKEGEKMGREEESRDLFELTAHISGKVGELSGVKLRRREVRLKGSENRLRILRLSEQGEKVQTDWEHLHYSSDHRKCFSHFHQ